MPIIPPTPSPTYSTTGSPYPTAGAGKPYQQSGGFPGGTDPSYFWNALFQGRAPYQGTGGAANAYARGAGEVALHNILRGGDIAAPIGYANLASILAGNGYTDPRRLNMELTDISRSGQANQDRIRETMAGMGLGGSLLTPALEGAAGNATQVQRSRAIAGENALAEQRRRQDLQLLYNLVLGPSLQGYGIERGYQGALDTKPSDIGSLLSGVGGIMGGAGALGLAFGACWVAREVYGVRNPKWLRFRHWMLNMAQPSLRSSYLKHGPALARWLRRHPEHKPAYRMAMDRILAIEGL